MDRFVGSAVTLTRRSRASQDGSSSGGSKQSTRPGLLAVAGAN
jgi:hypothetical protein